MKLLIISLAVASLLAVDAPDANQIKSDETSKRIETLCNGSYTKEDAKACIDKLTKTFEDLKAKGAENKGKKVATDKK